MKNLAWAAAIVTVAILTSLLTSIVTSGNTSTTPLAFTPYSLRTETYQKQPNGTTSLLEATETAKDDLGQIRLKRIQQGIAGEDRLASPSEAEGFLSQEKSARKLEARERFIQAVLTNKAGGPWGPILYDWAVAEGLVEPIR